MSPLRDEDVITLLREDVAALDPRPASVGSAVTTGRRRVRARRVVVVTGALGVATVLAVAGLRLSGPDADRGLPTDTPTVRLTEDTRSPPDPQPVYDAVESRLVAMGLPTTVRWRAGPLGGADDGTALATGGWGLALTTADSSDQADPRQWCGGTAQGAEEPRTTVGR